MMSEKRFEIDFDEEAITDNGEFCLSLYCFQDKGEKAVCDLLNQLNDENEQLKQENEFAKLLANHRGEKVTFANSLIQDIDDELTQKMWYQFKEEMYQEWKKKRGIE